MRNGMRQFFRQLLCEHEFYTLYLDSRFHTEREALVHHWVRRCRKCGKVIRVESKRGVL